MTSQDQSPRAIAAAVILLAAVLMISRLIIERAPIRDWILPLLLLTLGIGLLLWDIYAHQPRSSVLRASGTTVSDYALHRSDATGAPVPATPSSAAEQPAELPPAPPQPAASVEAEPVTSAAVESASSQPETSAEPPPTAATKPARQQTATEDDLTVIEGIGPKISAALIAAGIRTFADLAAAPESRIREILTDAQLRIVGNVAQFIPTWAEQAALAADGRMDDLAAWRAAHKARQG